jgi:hypothetical protein
MLSSPDADDGVSSSLSAARLLSALDTHGPKVAVYLIVAQLLGVFEWASQNMPGMCG